jgi:hypothetical protein
VPSRGAFGGGGRTLLLAMSLKAARTCSGVSLSCARSIMNVTNSSNVMLSSAEATCSRKTIPLSSSCRLDPPPLSQRGMHTRTRTRTQRTDRFSPSDCSAWWNSSRPSLPERSLSKWRKAVLYSVSHASPRPHVVSVH